MDLLDEVRALLSHSEPKGDLLTVMKRGLEALRGELLKKRFGVGRKPRRVESRQRQGLKRGRHVPAAVAREVYVRDERRCTFCADDGRRCAERRLLQLDHVIAYAEGGEATVVNLRLRCRAHNLHTARVHFGFVVASTGAGTVRCSVRPASAQSAQPYRCRLGISGRARKVDCGGAPRYDRCRYETVPSAAACGLGWPWLARAG